jgi:hypothetical protein
VSFLTVETRREWVESFVVRQNEASKRVAQSGGAVFFNMDILLQGPEVPQPRLKEYVETFAAEHFFKTTSRLAYFDGDKWYHPDGESYNDFFDRAIAYHQDSPRLAERFRAEKEGYINAGYIVNQRRAMGEESPAWVIASPPGNVYRNKSFATRNVTFISIPICERSIQLGNGPEKVYQEYEMYVVPSEEMATREHWQAVVAAGNLEVSLSAIGMAADMVEEGDANFVAATPVLLESVIDLVAQLGYADFAEVTQEASRMLELDNDPFALERRQEMIEFFTQKMWHYLSRRDTLSSQDRLKLKGLADVMHDYLSSEAGLEYVGQTFGEIREMIEAHIMIHYRNSGVTFSNQELTRTNWRYAEMVHSHYFKRLGLNKLTQERRNATGCVFEGEETHSRGKYTEFYDYKPGVCAKCGKHKAHVAYPKNSEIKCAGWCSDCER